MREFLNRVFLNYFNISSLPVKRLLIFGILVLFIKPMAPAQNYGLEFMGHEVFPDQRSSLVIGEKIPLSVKNDFSLSFDIRFKPEVISYFGYLLRIIDGENHLDLVFNSSENGSFKMVTGNRSDVSSVPFRIDSLELYTTWNRLELKFLIDTKTVELYQNNQLVASSTFPESLSNFTLFFGGCNDKFLATTDVLPFYLRDIQIETAGKLRHEWKLNHLYGETAHDTAGKVPGSITNGKWLLQNHFQWKEMFETEVSGYTTFHFDPEMGQIYIHTDNGNLIWDSVKGTTGQRKSRSSHKKFTYGDQTYYRESDKTAVAVRLMQRQIFGQDKQTGEWNIPAGPEPNLTEFWHHNHYFYPGDTAIVLLGGYGQFTYKNRFQKYSFKDKKWSDLKLIGELPAPRYLFGMATTSDRSKSYLFGGYGSETGTQELNPQNYYDLYEINWITETVRKVYTLPVPKNPFAVARSMILDEQAGVFYALTFNQLVFSGEMQLIKGSLTEPEISKLGQTFPYRFMDVASFADLYFDKLSNRLIAVTSYYDRIPNKSVNRIFTLDFPPVTDTGIENNASSISNLALPGLIGLLIAVLVGFVVVFRKRKNEITTPIRPSISEERIRQPETTEETRTQVLLFGGFQLISKNGEDLTRQFTPLVKELFLYLLINAIQRKKAIGSTELNELFWFDKSERSARNNRSVNMVKLKSILEQTEGLELLKTKDEWTIQYDTHLVYIDYLEFLKISKHELNTPGLLKEMNEIIFRGKFLSNLDLPWLETTRSELTNRIIDSQHSYLRKLSLPEEAHEITEVCDNIFLFDPIDEVAMQQKCKALTTLGKHSVAQQCFEHFVKDYENLYAEPYGMSLREIIGH